MFGVTFSFTVLCSLTKMCQHISCSVSSLLNKIWGSVFSIKTKNWHITLKGFSREHWHNISILNLCTYLVWQTVTMVVSKKDSKYCMPLKTWLSTFVTRANGDSKTLWCLNSTTIKTNCMRRICFCVQAGISPNIVPYSQKWENPLKHHANL